MLAGQGQHVFARRALPWALTLLVSSLAPLAAAQAPAEPSPSATNRTATTAGAAGELQDTPTLSPDRGPPPPPRPLVAPWPPGPRQAVAEPQPVVLEYGEGAPLRTGYHLEQRPRLPLLVGGISLSGASYMSTVFTVAAISLVEANTDAVPGLIPLVGPLYVAGKSDFLKDARLRDVALGFLAGGSIGQALGLVLIVTAVTCTRTVQVLDPPGARGKGPFLRLDARGPALVF